MEQDEQDTDALIRRVCELLRKVHRWDWRRTSALARELNVDKTLLLKTLAAHAARDDRVIRYHRLPSPRPLDVLWGLIERVDEDPEARHSLERRDAPLHLPAREAGPTVFLSHNHRDADRVLEIANALAESGVAYWLYEGDIEQGDTIIVSVAMALEACDALLVYVSGNALGSTWVRKEFGHALTDLKAAQGTAVLVVLDGSDEGLLGCFDPDRPRILDRARVEAFVRRAAEERGEADEALWRNRALAFAHDLSQYVELGGAAAVYPPATARFGHLPFGDLSAVRRWAIDLLPTPARGRRHRGGTGSR